MSAIKNCPFCGAEPIALEYQPFDDTNGAIHCMNCDAYGPTATAKDPMAASYKKWSKR